MDKHEQWTKKIIWKRKDRKLPKKINSYAYDQNDRNLPEVYRTQNNDQK